MKHILFVLFLLPIFCQAQDFTKWYVAPTGDTIRPGDKVKINEGKNYTYIFPNYYDAANGSTKPSSIEKRKRYLIVNMPGNTYPIKRLSRIKVKKGVYRAIAAISVYDTELRLLDPVEYIIEIDNALKNEEIALVK